MRSVASWCASLLAVAALATGPAAAPGDAQAPDLASLLATFAAMPGMEAGFVEDKHMALLAAPLRSEGRLYYAPPGHLARHTTKPAPSVLLVEPDAVRFGDERGTETVDLAAKPVVRLFVESFVEILRGDRAALERLYAMSFQALPDARAGAWSLVLRPRISPMDKVFDRMELRGVGLAVHEMVMFERDGDRTDTRFTDVDPARRFSPEERARLFTLTR